MAKRRELERPFPYFRELFMKHPEWVWQKSNAPVIEKYRMDHGIPADEPIDKRIKEAMANAKSQVKKKLEAGGNGLIFPSGRGQSHITNVDLRMKSLEERIDECLMMARSMSASGLGHAIELLRQARNEIVLRSAKTVRS